MRNIKTTRRAMETVGKLIMAEFVHSKPAEMYSALNFTREDELALTASYDDVMAAPSRGRVTWGVSDTHLRMLSSAYDVANDDNNPARQAITDRSYDAFCDAIDAA